MRIKSKENDGKMKKQIIENTTSSERGVREKKIKSDFV
jgi:hypothetical protein